MDIYVAVICFKLFFVDRTAQNASDLHDYLDGEYKLSSQSDWLFNNLVHDSIAADVSSAPDSVNYEVPLTAYESFSTVNEIFA